MLDPDTLTQQYLDGTLTEAGAGDLHELLKARPELGEMLIQHIEMDAMLRATNPLVAENIIRPALPPKRGFNFATATGIAALAACITLLATWNLKPEQGPVPAEEATTASVALLRSGEDLEWESAAITPGTQLSPGLLKLKSGIALIEFYQGARVAIEGPAEFQLVSSGEATFTSGKLSATVPPQAVGFRINTPKGTIVDLGTEFGLDVSASNSEVHVFKGEVELHKTAKPVISLKESQAMCFSDDSRLLTADKSNFASLAGIKSGTDSSDHSQLKEWQARIPEMGYDPGLMLHFDFQDDETTRSLRNRAPRGEDGSIVGTAFTGGRWPGKNALEFRNVSDRVRLCVPGEINSLTMAISVRINSLDRRRSSLFASDGWDDRKVHWQILSDGSISFDVAARPGKGVAPNYNTPVYFTPDLFGSWVHLAVVFDSEANEVRHFANGTLIARLPLEDASPLKIGIAELGNWNQMGADGISRIRHLSGAVDEFVLWDRVLSNAEIEALAK